MFAYKPCPACGCQWRSILCIYDCSQIIALLNMYLLLGGGGSIHCNSAPRVTKSGNTSIKSGNNTPLLIWNRVGLYSPISSKQLSFILKPLWLNWKAAGYLFFAHGICLTLPSASLHFIFSLSLGSPPATWTKKKKKTYHLCWDSNLYSWNRTGIVFRLVFQPIQHWDYEDNNHAAGATWYCFLSLGTGPSEEREPGIKRQIIANVFPTYPSVSGVHFYLMLVVEGRRKKYTLSLEFQYLFMNTKAFLLPCTFSLLERKKSVKMAK